MTLNASGPLSMGGATVGQSINLELGVSATALASINSASFRTLAGVASGQISISNFYGKSNTPNMWATMQVADIPNDAGNGYAPGAPVLIGGGMFAYSGTAWNNQLYQVFTVYNATTGVVSYSKQVAGTSTNTTLNLGNMRYVSGLDKIFYQNWGGSGGAGSGSFNTPTTSASISYNYRLWRGFNAASGTGTVTGYWGYDVDSSGNAYITLKGYKSVDIGCCCFYEVYGPGFAKYDVSGNFVLAKVNNTSDATENRNWMPMDLRVNASSTYLYQTCAPQTNGGNPQNRFAIIKYNLSGVVQWTQYYTSAVSSMVYGQGCSAGIDSSDNMYFLSGSYSNQIAQVAKINSSGAVVWSTKISTGGQPSPYGVIADSSGNVYAACGGVHPTRGTNAIFIIKLNSSGTVQWIRMISTVTSGAPGVNMSQSLQNFVTDNNSLYIVFKVWPLTGNRAAATLRVALDGSGTNANIGFSGLSTNYNIGYEAITKTSTAGDWTAQGAIPSFTVANVTVNFTDNYGGVLNDIAPTVYKTTL